MIPALRPVGLAVEGIAYHYPDGTAALGGVSLAVAPGDRVALLGPNGAGKSTLLLHLAALLPEKRRYLHRHAPGDAPHRHGLVGRIAIDGIDVAPGRVRDIRERVGLLFQDPDDQLIGLTVFDDVAYGPRARRWPEADVGAAVEAALAAVGLAAFGRRSPHHLSVGEKRRVCLAGVLACRPGLLLLDEPSSGLDPRGRRELALLLAALPATQVIATHDLEFARRLCTRAVVLEGGAVAADRPLDALLEDPATLARLGLS